MLGQTLRTLRKKRGLTQGQLQVYSGVPRAHISQIETGVIAHPSLEVLFKLARGLGVSADMLIQADRAGAVPDVDILPPDPHQVGRAINTMEATMAELRRLMPGNTIDSAPTISIPPMDLLPLVPAIVYVPLTTQRAAAGGAPSGMADTEIIPYIPTPAEMGHQLAATIISGDCMEPEIPNGSWVIYDLQREPTDGSLVAATYDHETVVKRLEVRDDEWWLVANRGWEAVRVADRVRILGVAIAWGRRL